MDTYRVRPSHGLLGQSSRICEIREKILKIGRSRSPVLLLGESGTGKEVVAQAIHQVENEGNFVPIDCGSLVGPLVESELFGHIKGSFTGASESRKGLIEAANNGTAFFDEIGDLPLEMQVKLLRVLQEREYRPVGSVQRHKVHIRIIAATHRDLASDVEAHRFRQDLFFRLKVVTLRLPPLRERKEDIPVLIEHFLSRHDKRHTVAKEAMDTLLGYDWPGNVRELENCISHMVTMNSGPLLHRGDLPSNVTNSVAIDYRSMAAAATHAHAVPARPASFRSGTEQSPAVPSPIVPLEEVEKRAILNALEYTKGDRGMAAHLLGIGRTTLYRKLKDYRLVN
ncbi:MAG: sigma-54 dependent transcriptional regulator [Bryobacteraceae bacterium]